MAATLLRSHPSPGVSGPRGQAPSAVPTTGMGPKCVKATEHDPRKKKPSKKKDRKGVKGNPKSLGNKNAGKKTPKARRQSYGAHHQSVEELELLPIEKGTPSVDNFRLTRRPTPSLLNLKMQAKTSVSCVEGSKADGKSTTEAVPGHSPPKLTFVVTTNSQAAGSWRETGGHEQGRLRASSDAADKQTSESPDSRPETPDNPQCIARSERLSRRSASSTQHRSLYNVRSGTWSKQEGCIYVLAALALLAFALIVLLLSYLRAPKAPQKLTGSTRDVSLANSPTAAIAQLHRINVVSGNTTKTTCLHCKMGPA